MQQRDAVERVQAENSCFKHPVTNWLVKKCFLEDCASASCCLCFALRAFLERALRNPMITIWAVSVCSVCRLSGSPAANKWLVWVCNRTLTDLSAVVEAAPLHLHIVLIDSWLWQVPGSHHLSFVQVFQSWNALKSAFKYIDLNTFSTSSLHTHLKKCWTLLPLLKKLIQAKFHHLREDFAVKPNLLEFSCSRAVRVWWNTWLMNFVCTAVNHRHFLALMLLLHKQH